MTFLKNCWYVACWSDDLAADTILHRTILGEPVVLYRKGKRPPVALFDMCPHRFAPLSKGQLMDDGGIMCSYHGLRFGPDGACRLNPNGDGRIPGRARVRAYDLVERHSLVWIWMGDEPARPDEIPDFVFLDPAAGFAVSRRETLHMPCNYRLIVDNLLDLSHISFLHDGILGNAETAKAELSIEKTRESVTVTRVARNVPMPELFALLQAAQLERGDLYNTISWRLASNLLNDALVCAPGADRLSGAGIFGAHLLTPETEDSTHYHIAAAPQQTTGLAKLNEAHVRDRLSELRRFAFKMQDQPMIVAQAANMRSFPEATKYPAFLDIDAGPAQAQAILKSRIEREKRQGDGDGTPAAPASSTSVG